MREAPEPVLLYIPLMKELNMSWSDIKNTPRYELEGLLRGVNMETFIAWMVMMIKT